MSDFGVDQWVELFDAVGLDEGNRHQWHRSFEQRHPQAHQSFLEWLGLDAQHIKDVRDKSR